MYAIRSYYALPHAASEFSSPTAVVRCANRHRERYESCESLGGGEPGHVAGTARGNADWGASAADAAVVHQAVSGCELIFHQAALVSAPYSIENPKLTYRTNVAGTFNVLEAARQAGIGRIIYASSSAIYGNLPGLPKREDDPLQSRNNFV